MIAIINKKDCVGCRGCVQICPKSCISFNEDEQGFCYPKVNLDLCIHCNLCEKVCPVINQSTPRKPLAVYAAKNSNADILDKSSSGGIFYALAADVIKSGGVVFGARFNDEWNVVHDFAETFEDVTAFQTSKYVQSDIGDSYIKVREFLKRGRKVLFSGTPCQIAGLNLFLRKDYGNQLLKVDIVCHGVPSPRVWKDYMQYHLYQLEAAENLSFQSMANEIVSINFRDKKLGWQNYGLSVYASHGKDNKENQSVHNSSEPREVFFEPHYQNLYMQGFLKDLYLRPSCYACPAKCGKSNSNITLGDFWGIRTSYPDYYSGQYYSLLLVKSSTCDDILASIEGIDIKETTYEAATRGNPSIEMSARKPSKYEEFWLSYQKTGLKAIETTVRSMQPSIMARAITRIKYILKRALR